MQSKCFFQCIKKDSRATQASIHQQKGDESIYNSTQWQYTHIDIVNNVWATIYQFYVCLEYKLD